MSPHPSPPPQNPPPEPAPAESGWHRFCRRAHRCAWVAWLLLVLALAPLLGLWIIGLPAPLANRVLAGVGDGAFTVTADRIGLAPRHGLLLNHILIYPADSFAEPLLRADQVILRPRLLPLLVGRIEPRRILLNGVTLLAPPWTTTPPAGTDARLELTGVAADVRFDKRRIAVDRLTGRLGPIALDIRGVAETARGATGKHLSPHTLQAQLTQFQQAPRALPEWINLLADTRAEQPASLRLNFSIAPTQSTAGLHLSGGPFTIRGRTADHVEVHAAWHEGRLHLYDARLRAAGRVSTLSARWSPGQNEIEARGDWELPPTLLHALLPRPRHAAFAANRLDSTGGTLRLNWKLGPAAPADLRATLRGDFAFDHLALRGVHAAHARGQFEGGADALHLRGVETQFGADGSRGSARGDFTWHAAAGQLDGRLDLDVDPRDFIPFLTSNQTRLVQRFDFPAARPHFTGTFRRPAGGHDLELEGRLTSGYFHYRGVPIDSLQTDITHSNHTLALTHWRFTRPEGATTGTLSSDLRGRLIHVDLHSTMHPAAIAGCVGPKLLQAVSAWRFEGPVTTHARGVVDGTGTEQETDLLLDADGKRMGRGRWLADEARFTLHAHRGAYTVTNLTGRGYDGDFHGTVHVTPAPAGPEHRYQVDIVLTNADFARVAEGYAQPGDTPLAGRVHLDLQLTGLVSDAFGPATRGGGALRIEDGALFRLRLLGGLSDLLGRLVPGLGFASQTDLTCTFDIENGVVYSEDLRLAGAVISMKADGEIEFDGRVRIRVEVQLMRRGPIAFVLRLLTRPVTKLFEFQLSGTLADPKWRPVNLPKELFLIFD